MNRLLFIITILLLAFTYSFVVGCAPKERPAKVWVGKIEGNKVVTPVAPISDDTLTKNLQGRWRHVKNNVTKEVTVQGNIISIGSFSKSNTESNNFKLGVAQSARQFNVVDNTHIKVGQNIWEVTIIGDKLIIKFNNNNTQEFEKVK